MLKTQQRSRAQDASIAAVCNEGTATLTAWPHGPDTVRLRRAYHDHVTEAENM